MSKEGFLALKVQVYGAFADLGSLGDVVYRGPMEAFFEKDLLGRAKDGLASFLLLPLAARPGRHTESPPLALTRSQ